MCTWCAAIVDYSFSNRNVHKLCDVLSYHHIDIHGIILLLMTLIQDSQSELCLANIVGLKIELNHVEYNLVKFVSAPWNVNNK